MAGIFIVAETREIERHTHTHTHTWMREGKIEERKQHGRGRGDISSICKYYHGSAVIWDMFEETLQEET